MQNQAVEYGLFNVAELTPVEGLPGAKRLSRYPQRLERSYQLPGGKLVSRNSFGCEIRLIPTGDRVLFRLSTPDNAKVHIHQGDYWLDCRELTPGVVTEWVVEVRQRLRELPDEARQAVLFSPDVLRLRVERGTLYLHGIDAYQKPTAKPGKLDVPKTRWLAYGSSITQCDAYGYVHQAGHRLGVDVLNKGMSGSCGAEQATAEFLVNECRWDFATLELGINMRGSVEVDDFTRRVDTLLSMFVETGKPIFVITVFTNDVHMGVGDPVVAKRQNGFDEALRAAVDARKKRWPNVHLIEGTEVLKEYRWLAGDLVHPTHDGQNMMGERLAAMMAPALSLGC